VYQQAYRICFFSTKPLFFLSHHPKSQLFKPYFFVQSMEKCKLEKCWLSLELIYHSAVLNVSSKPNFYLACPLIHLPPIHINSSWVKFFACTHTRPHSPHTTAPHTSSAHHFLARPYATCLGTPRKTVWPTPDLFKLPQPWDSTKPLQLVAHLPPSRPPLIDTSFDQFAIAPPHTAAQNLGRWMPRCPTQWWYDGVKRISRLVDFLF